MKNKFALCMILILICSAFSFANEFQTSSSKMVGSHSSDFRLNNNIVRFSAGGSYGKVASDREAMNNNNFRTFKTFRNASIGMFIPGALFFTGATIGLSIFVSMILTAENAVGGSAAAITEAFQAASLLSLGGVYACIALLTLSGVFLTCGIAFAIVAGVFHHKWAEERGIISYNSLSEDKPQFAQGFRVLL